MAASSGDRALARFAPERVDMTKGALARDPERLRTGNDRFRGSTDLEALIAAGTVELV